MKERITFMGCIVFALASCDFQDHPYVPPDPYVPSIQLHNSGGTYYRFSEAQLQRMRKTPLSRDLFLRFIEKKWPPDGLRAFCKPENRWDPNCQNLVSDGLLFGSWKIPVHSDKKLEFDRLYVYMCEDDGSSNYYGTAGTKWKRWEYSLNIEKGTDVWVFIGSLPNDLVDNPAKYLAGNDPD
jgi:hypothetical protein